MDGRRNWILLDAVSSQPTNAPIRVGGRSFPATHSRDEQSFATMNKLNERIQRRLAEQSEAKEGIRVVDDSFRFIDDEPTERLDQLIAQRDSRGEVEAIFERRREPDKPARRIEPRMWPAIEELPEPPDNGDAGENAVYKNSPALYLEPSMRFDNRYRRRESVDSQATRVVRASDYNTNYPRIIPTQEDRRPQMTLRRTPLFYDKCDLCAYKIFRTGDFCPACGRTASPVRNHFPSRSPRTNHSYTEMLLSPPRLMYEPWANRHYSGYMTRPRQHTHYNQNITRPRTMWTARRRVRPVYRYGTSLPEALYDYEVWAKKKDSRRNKRKAAAIALALLALALVISAGVVLAAVKN